MSQFSRAQKETPLIKVSLVDESRRILNELRILFINVSVRITTRDQMEIVYLIVFKTLRKNFYEELEICS